MYKQKIGISIGSVFSPETLQIIKNAGFDAVSPEWGDHSNLESIVKAANELGLELQSLHAPFGKANKMWSADENIGNDAKNDLIPAIDACAEFGIPITVVHTWIGFEYEFDEGSLFYGNFDDVVEHARSLNVKIAFENTEGIEYFDALMKHYENDDTVGFCWDSGHEMCYNYSEDLLAKYGDRLIMTHLNDNLGISRYDGVIFWTDDLHLLPYDGIADWDHNVERLKKSKHMPILNFELGIGSKPNRHENDCYAQMPRHLYYTEAYKRACKIAYRYSNNG